MRYMLKTKFGFLDNDIVMLTDDQADPRAWPTRANMVRYCLMYSNLPEALPQDTLTHCACEDLL